MIERNTRTARGRGITAPHATSEESAALRPIYFLAALTSVAVVVRGAGGEPPVPVTVKRYVPCAVEELTVIVNAEVLVAGFGLKLPVAPAGRPLTDKVTEELKPAVGVIVTV